MKIREIITEIIDTTESFDPVKNAIYRGISRGLKWLYDNRNDINIPQEAIDEYDNEGNSSKLTTFIKNKTDYKERMKTFVREELYRTIKKMYPEVENIGFDELTGAQALVDTSTGVIWIDSEYLNPKLIAGQMLDGLVYQLFYNGMTSVSDLFSEINALSQDLEKNKEESERLYYINRNSRGLANLTDKIDEVAGTMIHELVHSVQVGKDKSGGFNYRSYYGTKKFHDLSYKNNTPTPDNEIEDEEQARKEKEKFYKMHGASPQEITAYANTIARNIAKVYFDTLEGYHSEEFTKTMNTPDYRKDLRDERVSQVNQQIRYTPQTNAEKKVWKRYVSQILALVNAQFARHVAKLKEKEKRTYS